MLDAATTGRLEGCDIARNGVAGVVILGGNPVLASCE